MNNKHIRIGSRKSPLAVRQAEIIKNLIHKAHPGIVTEIVTYTTTGDRILDKSLDSVGGKGLFVKELDVALVSGEIDIAVHSLKDMPMDTPEEIPILAYSAREDPRDALLLPAGISELPPDAIIGCSSARRKWQLLTLLPNVSIAGIRGNIHTRIGKLDTREYDAIVLACAGLLRMDMGARISRVFEPDEMVPAAGQGILAVQARAGECGFLKACLNDEHSELCATAERAFVRALGGGCTAPVAAYAQIDAGNMQLSAFIADEATGNTHKGDISGAAANAEQLGEKLASQMNPYTKGGR